MPQIKPNRGLIALAITLAGVGLVAVGAALVYLPAGLIIAGVLLALFGLFVLDVDGGDG